MAETKEQKDWRLARSLGHDDAILYLLGQSVRAAKLSMRQRGELAMLSAIRAITLADAANSVAIRKRSKALRLTKGYWDEIFRARELAAEANLNARGQFRSCGKLNSAFTCTLRAGHDGKHKPERFYD